ncbi:MAG TPA: hypothetical protein VLG16_04675 [Candidatus Saccharimonadales bacterium]|nr:hypothetical protein [Candidatus Saccharimonadales bacterium]
MFKIVGALGLLIISVGIITKNRGRQNLFYIVGGVLLEAYSIHLRDGIFIILQIVFTLAAIYDFVKTKRSR